MATSSYVIKKAVAIITARGGSKRIPHKNIRPFLGRPIISYSTQQEQHGELTVYKVSMFIKIHHRSDVQALFTFIQSLPQITLTSIE